MTTRRISLLGLVLTSLVSSVGWSQSQVPAPTQPSSRQTVSAQAAPSSTRSPQPATDERENWLKRLVLGESEKSEAKPAAVEFSQWQASSRQVSAPPVASGSPTPASQIAGPSQRLPAVQSQPAAKDEGGNWFKRLVVGESGGERAATDTVQFAPPQQNTNSRQAAPAQSSNTAPSASSRVAATKPTAVSKEPPPAARNERSGWLRRLVVGRAQGDGKSNSPAAPVAPQSTTPRMMSGLFGPPQNAPTAPQANSLAGQTPAGQTPAAHVPRTMAGPQQDPRLLANSLNDAKESAQRDKIEPDPDRSVSLTNWISRLHRRSPSAEVKMQPSNSLAPAAVADRSLVAGVREPDLAPPQPNAQSLASAPISGDATADSANSLTDWLSRPFRSGDSAQEQSLASQQGAPGLSNTTAPVRLPAVSQTPARLSPDHYARLELPSAPAGIGNTEALRYGTANADAVPPVRFGSNVRLSAADAAQPSIAATSVSGSTNTTPAIGSTSRVPSTTASQPAAPPMMMSQPRPMPQIDQHASAWPLAGEAYESPSAPEAGGNPLGRPKIIFHPLAGVNGRGQATLKPTVEVAHGDEVSESYPAMRFAQAPEGDSLPPPARYAPEEGPEGPTELPVEQVPDDWMPMETPYEGPMTAHEAAAPFLECFYTVLAHMNGPRSCPPGIGVENVMNAPFWLDTTQPLQNCRIRGDAAADWEFPDRIEYFWAKTPGGKGPAGPPDPASPDPLNPVPLLVGEPNVDYQEVSFYIERGGERFSVGTDIPIRAVDPKIRRNTTGLADMRVTTKTVLLDGKEWQLTQILHTHIPTGSFRRGTGNGHLSLEPGVAWRYKWSDVTYIHGDLTYWFPIAADPFHSGQMFNYGIGISHIWIDGDKWALMPTLELNAWTILDGQQTLPGTPVVTEEIDTLSILNIHPGLRWVCDTAGDCGVREFGITSGFTVTEDHWYEEILRLEMRWVF